MSKIQIRTRHLDTDETHSDVKAASERGEEITPAAAVTIASWWQAPGGTGYVLAGFASGAKVDRDELLEDIFYTSTEAYRDGNLSVEDKLALDMLSTFVIRYEK